jgi:four helix bundle protein
MNQSRDTRSANANTANENEFRFEKWNVWHSAREVSVLVIRLTQEFPKEERIGLAMTLRSQATDLTAMISSASVTWDQDEKVTWLDKAYRSGQVLASHIFIAGDLKWLSDEQVGELLGRISQITGQIGGLRKSILSRDRENDGGGGQGNSWRRNR